METLMDLLTAENLKMTVIVALTVIAAWGWVGKLLGDIRAKNWSSLVKHFVGLVEGVQSGTIAPDESKAYMAVKTDKTREGVLLNGTLAAMGELGKSKEKSDAD